MLIDDKAKKQEFSCANVIIVVQYLEDVVGIEKAKSNIETLGLPLPFLKNKSNWVSFEYYNKLLDLLVNVTGDKKAPLKVSFSKRTFKAYDFIVYITSSSLWLGAPGIVYKIIFGTGLYKLWSKIGEFSIQSLTSNSMRLKMTLKSEYKQTVNNCMVVKGLLSFIPTAMNLPPAEVREIECSANEADSCLYHVTWQNQRNWFLMLGFPILVLLILLQRTAFRDHFEIKDSVITALLFFSTHFSLRSFRYRQSLKSQESVNEERNEHLVSSMEKMEIDYRELLKVKRTLEGRNIFLSVINEISGIVSDQTEKELLISQVAHIICKELKQKNYEFFEYKKFDNAFVSLLHKDEQITAEKEDMAILKSLNPGDSSDSFSYRESSFSRWIREKNGNKVYFLPVSVHDSYSGFYIFKGSSRPPLSSELITDLFNNISSQLRVALEKITSNQTIKNILTSIPANVLIFDMESYKIKFVNDFFASSFPSIDKPAGAAFTDKDLFSIFSFPPEFRENIIQSVGNMDMEKQPEIYEVSSGSSAFEYTLFAIPELEYEEKIAGLILSDVTEAKYFHDKLLFNEKLLALGKVASGIAHEINNPLYAVLANSEEIAENEELDETTRKYADENCNYIITVSNIVKDLSKYSKSLRRTDKVKLNINSLIDESLKLVRYSLNFLEIEIEKEFSQIPDIQIERGEIQQVFINLFNNAIQAMNGKGVLKIKTYCENDFVHVIIEDTGAGIPAIALPHIFDLFFTTKGREEGTGQGLHIVKRIMTSIKGTIEVSSVEGKGSAFHLVFSSGIENE